MVGPASDFDVSVLICTRNRPRELELALRSVEGSSLPVREIIVSDDSTGEDCRALVEGFPSAQWVAGPRIGLGANRNRALQEATGTHVLFIDDDVEVSRDFLTRVRERWARVAAEDRGKVIFAGAETQGSHEITPNEQSFLGFQKRRYGSEEALKTVVINAAVFPRNLFDEILFDPLLVYGYDEVDLATRAVASGFRIERCFEAINKHNPSATNRSYYAPHINASRLYVTFKRRLLEGKSLSALAFACIAASHLWMSSIRREGLAGHRTTLTALGLGWRAYRTDPTQSLSLGRAWGKRISYAAQLERRARALRTLGATRAGGCKLYALALLLSALHEVDRLSPRSWRISIRHGQRTIRCTVDSRSDLEVLREVFLEQQYRVDLVDEPRVIFDLGSNIGLSILWFACEYPSATIYGFEPDPRNFRKLRVNVGSLDGVSIAPVAIGGHDGHAAFRQAHEGWRSALASASDGEDDVIEVTTQTLRTAMDRAGVERIDLLKVDIEGAERDLLASGQSLGSVAAIVGELHLEGWAASAREALGILEGFEILVMAESNEHRQAEFVALATGRS